MHVAAAQLWMSAGGFLLVAGEIGALYRAIGHIVRQANSRRAIYQGAFGWDLPETGVSNGLPAA